jgi:hypothetical protein
MKQTNTNQLMYYELSLDSDIFLDNPFLNELKTSHCKHKLQNNARLGIGYDFILWSILNTFQLFRKLNV